MKKLVRFSLLVSSALWLNSCASYQSDMNNNLPNEHNVPLNQTMPADNDPSVSMD